MELLHIIVKYNIPDSEGFYFYFYFNMTHTVYHINIMERYINQQTESIGIIKKNKKILWENIDLHFYNSCWQHIPLHK